MAIKYPENYSLGQAKTKGFPKVQFEKIKEIIDKVNDLDDGDIDVDTITPPSGALTVNGDQETTGNQFVDGTLSVTGEANIIGNTSLSGLLLLTGTPQTLTGAGAVNLTTKVTLLVTTGANALTLAAGTDGQIKIIKHKTDGGDGTLTVTGASGFSTITFTAVGQTATLLYKDSTWNIISVFGATVA